MGEVVIGARSAGGDDEPGRGPGETGEGGGPPQGPAPGPEGGGRPKTPPDTGRPAGAGVNGGGSPPGPPSSAVPPSSAFPPAGPPGPAAGAGPASGPAETPGEEAPEKPVGPGDGASGNGASGNGASGEAASGKPKKKGSFWKELPLLLGIALVLALLIKTFLVQAFSIPSESMENTIRVGDRVLVNKFSPWFGAEPERGQVVVFHDPGGWLGNTPSGSENGFVRAVQTGLSFVGLMPSADEKDLIKRVIAKGGDRIQCCDAQGRLLLNGKPLDESSYLKPGVAPSEIEFDVTVPEGRLWLMGDNRADSSDSRYHQNEKYQGTVDEDKVIGRAFSVVWPLDRIRGLGVPGVFDQSFGSAALGTASLAGAVPFVLWRRRRAFAHDVGRDTTPPPAGAPPAT